MRVGAAASACEGRFTAGTVRNRGSVGSLFQRDIGAGNLRAHPGGRGTVQAGAGVRGRFGVSLLLSGFESVRADYAHNPGGWLNRRGCGY